MGDVLCSVHLFQTYSLPVCCIATMSHGGHKLGMGHVTGLALTYDYLACGLDLGGWHVVLAWAMPHDGRDYLAHDLGKGLHHLMSRAWAWTMSYGHLAHELWLDS